METWVQKKPSHWFLNGIIHSNLTYLNAVYVVPSFRRSLQVIIYSDELITNVSALTGDFCYYSVMLIA